MRKERKGGERERERERETERDREKERKREREAVTYRIYEISYYAYRMADA